MGQSTDAILFYGYSWDEEDAAPLWAKRDEDGYAIEEDEEGDDRDGAEWESRWAALHGVNEPSAPWGDEPRDVDTPARLEHHAYWEAKRKLVDACTVEIGTHCSGECPMWFVAVKATRLLASRGTPKRVAAPLKVPEGADEQLEAFMTKMGIPKPAGQSEPAWWLVSDWN